MWHLGAPCAINDGHTGNKFLLLSSEQGRPCEMPIQVPESSVGQLRSVACLKTRCQKVIQSDPEAERAVQARLGRSFLLLTLPNPGLSVPRRSIVAICQL